MINDDKLREQLKDYTHINWKWYPPIHGNNDNIKPGDWVTSVENYETGHKLTFINGELYKDYGKR